MGRGPRRFFAAACVAGVGVVLAAPAALAGVIDPLPPLGTERPKASAAAAVNDPGTPLQWGLDLIGAADAWQVSTGAGITIAIVDSGADLTHVDLKDRIAGAATCVDTGGDVAKCVAGGVDDNGHGTHVAGVASATRDNGEGVSGVAPGASLLIVKVLKQNCADPTPISLPGDECHPEGTAPDVSAGIRYAADNGAQVINLSVGSLTQSLLGPSFADALRYAWSKGAIPIVAAGNDDDDASGFTDQPAVVVTAVDQADERAAKANGVGAAQWGIAAPGGGPDTRASCEEDPNGILSTYWISGETDAYACLPGTSAAAPHVAGAAAILRAAGMSPEQTVERLLSSAKDLGEAGRDATFGAGRLDLTAAVAGFPVTSTTQPPPSTSSDPATTTTTTADQPVVTAPPTSSTTTAPPVIELPAGAPPDTAGQENLANQRSDDELPGFPVAAAVLLAVAVGCGSGILLMRGASWARRTPMR